VKRLRQWFSQLDLFGNGNTPELVDHPIPSEKKEVVKPVASPKIVSPEIEIHFAPRLRKGWRLEWRTFGAPQLTLPRYMAKPEFAEVVAWIKNWSVLTRRRKTPQLRVQIKTLEQQIWKETESILQVLGTPVVGRGDRMPPLRTQGRVHDLAPHFSYVNERYFQNTLHCRVTWSGRAGGLSFHTMRKDRQTGEMVDLVSISRGYDFENCPDYALRGILYHECLHAAIPPQKREQRRVVHGRDFRERERQFEHYEEWKKWHAEVLPRNVRKLIRESRNR